MDIYIQALGRCFYPKHQCTLKYTFFHCVWSLGIEPMTLMLQASCSNRWANTYWLISMVRHGEKAHWIQYRQWEISLSSSWMYFFTQPNCSKFWDSIHWFIATPVTQRSLPNSTRRNRTHWKSNDLECDSYWDGWISLNKGECNSTLRIG